MNRLASYRKVPDGYTFHVYFLKLSEAGFYYTGERLKVRCEGCRKEISLDDMNQDEYVLNPRNAKFHNSACEFVKNADVEITDTLSPYSSNEVNKAEANGGDLQKCYNGLTPSNEFKGRELQTMKYKHNEFKGIYIYDGSIDVHHEIEKHNGKNGTHCDKNPGHYGYFPVKMLKVDHLPGHARHPSVLKLVQLLSLITVRVKVQIKTESGHYCQFGTGFVSLDLCDNLSNSNNHKAKTDLSRLNEVFIATSRNLVQSSQDPDNVTVDFCYEDQAHDQMMSIKVASVLTFEQTGDHKALLVCRISEPAFVQSIYQTTHQILELVGNIPDKVKDCLSKKVFLIHHPHGRDKVLSHGDFVQVKNKFVPDVKTRTLTLQKISKTEPVMAEAVKGTMKMLMYTADTCHGSIGAPVITFTSRAINGQFYLDFWIHNGHHKTHGLGCSVMKVCETKDFEMIQHSAGKVTGEAEAPREHREQDSSQTRPLTPPQPSYPAFITKQKRLDSFVNWSHQHIHEPEYLANIGFFYAGYSDCVRCFQCGLGLRSWKPGDNVLEEHKKLRANCSFLQTILDNVTR